MNVIISILNLCVDLCREGGTNQFELIKFSFSCVSFESFCSNLLVAGDRFLYEMPSFA